MVRRYNEIDIFDLYEEKTRTKKEPLSITHPDIDKDWDYGKNKSCGKWDYDKNGDLTPEKVTAGSHIIIDWICSSCGYKWETKIYNRALNDSGCPKCAIIKRSILQTSDTEEFIKKATEAQKIYGRKYNYSKVKYKNNHTEVIFVCPDHGEFEQTPLNHLSGHGCPKCAIIKRAILQTSNAGKLFVQKAIEVQKTYGRKYNYSKVKYKNSYTKVIFICSDHGEFEQTPSDHLSGRGCPKCAGKVACEENCLSTTHPDICKEWDYEKNGDLTPKKVTYGSTIIIDWKCSRCGHEWKSTPNSRTNKGSGCPNCIFKNQKEVGELLEKHFFDWKISHQKKIYNKKVLGKSRNRKCDFWMEKNDIKVMVEYDGEQHFMPVSFGSMKKSAAEEEFKLQREKDKNDAIFCKEKGIILHRIKYSENKEKSIKKLKKKISKKEK